MMRRRRRAPTSAPAHGSGSVCLALMTREVIGLGLLRPIVPRQCRSLRQVLRQEEGGVLLGFSSDGNFLIYSVWRGSLNEIQWKRVGLQDFQRSTEDGEALETVFTLCVSGATSLYGVNAPLQVWQSVDHALVLAITTDRLAEDRETPGLCHVTVAPSPVFDNGGDTTAVTSLSFRFTRHASAQKMEPWQLMQLVSGPDAPQNVYHLLVNAGTSVQILVFQARGRQAQGDADPSARREPRGLGISHFAQNEWYYPPTFPTKMHESTQHRSRNAVNSDRNSFSIGVELICEHLFDVERFLGSFLETFRPLRLYNLVDYDLRLIRASTIEKTVFLTNVVALAPSLTPSQTEHSRDETSRCQLRVALFFSLELFTGVHHIIRALKVPGKESLRHISHVVARRFLADLNARLPHEPMAMRWSNDALLREESLRVLHNPVYPLSISID